jgi:UTP--glucose-1-phosphate uridylyltransferase
MLKKAIIPAAGWGTRLFPATKVLKKEFFPIIDTDGRAKPVILLIVEELISAGIEEIAIVIQKGDRELFATFFKQKYSPDLVKKISPENQEYNDYLESLGEKITFLYQEGQEGFGHAIFCAKDWIGGDCFLISLGDHIYKSHVDISCSRQLINIYQKYKKSTVGLTTMPADIIHKAGVVTGTWLENDRIMSVGKLWEKPDLDYARSQLHIEGMPADEFLAVFGLYILSARIFDYLEDEIKNNRRCRGEFQLTTCLHKLCQQEGIIGYLIDGQYFDTGMPEFYRQTIINFPR